MDLNRQQDLDIERVREHVEALAGKFDTVQIFVTRHDPTEESTVSYNVGAGNWHARKGQVTEWVLQQDEASRLEAGGWPDGD